jgi:hypothetical protein
MVADVQELELDAPRLEVVLSLRTGYKLRSRDGEPVEVLREYDVLARKVREEILGEEGFDLQSRYPFLAANLGCLGAVSDLIDKKDNEDRNPMVDDRFHINVCLYGAKKEGELEMHANLNEVLTSFY